jgi:hypothetical protein
VLTLPNIPQGVDDNTLCVVYADNLGCTVWCTAVVDKTSNTTHLCRIDDRILVNTEEVTGSDTLLVVSHLAQICNALSDLLADILDDHVVGCNVLLSIQTPIVDGGPVKLDKLLSLLELVETQGITFGTSQVLGDVDIVHHTTIVRTVCT